MKQSNQEDASPATTSHTTEKEIYNRYMQAYIDDFIDEYMGDMEFCDDLDFLYNDPDEVEEEKLCISFV